MSDSVRTFTPKEITQILTTGFAAPLIISTLAFILFGINCHQFGSYFTSFNKKDPFLTRIWIAIVMIINSAAACYQVYFDWSYSITLFTNGPSLQSRLYGNSVVLYSVEIMLVQLFWVVCIDAMLETKHKDWITGSVALGSVCSFGMAIAVGVLSTTRPGPNGTWPTPTISIFLRVVLGLDLGIDALILITVLTRLAQMKKALANQQTVSKLSYIYVFMTTCSTLIVIGELIINAPQPGAFAGWVPINITFAPLIAPLYTASMLSIMNARGDLQLETSNSQEGYELGEDYPEDEEPQMIFTNPVYSRDDRDSRQSNIRSRAATEPADMEREGDSIRRRYSSDGSADQIESGPQFGIQTI